MPRKASKTSPMALNVMKTKLVCHVQWLYACHMFGNSPIIEIKKPKSPRVRRTSRLGMPIPTLRMSLTHAGPNNQGRHARRLRRLIMMYYQSKILAVSCLPHLIFIFSHSCADESYNVDKNQVTDDDDSDSDDENSGDDEDKGERKKKKKAKLTRKDVNALRQTKPTKGAKRKAIEIDGTSQTYV